MVTTAIRPVILRLSYRSAPPQSSYYPYRSKEKLAIVGVNGAGKTTLTCLIMNLLQPTEGEVLLNGKNSILRIRTI